MINKQARFLVLRGGAIGDFIMTLPALSAMRERWPGGYIELVGYTHIAKLAKRVGLVDKVSALDAMGIHQLYSLRPSFSDSLIEFIQSFDVVLSYLHDPNGVVFENLQLAGAEEVLYGPPVVETLHASQHLLEPLATLAVYPEFDENGELPARLDMGEDAKQKGQRWLEQHVGTDAVALHPGSGSPKKNWMLDRYLELARRIKEEGIAKPLLILGEADQAIEEELRRGLTKFPILKHSDLEVVAEVLTACKAYVGNDSGITHLAAAVGTPTLSLFGPSDPELWGARGRHVHILRAPDGDLDAVQVDDVFPILGKIL